MSTELQEQFISYGSTFILGFILGIVVGFVFPKLFRGKEIKNWQQSLISVVVLIAWTFSVVIDVAIPTYTTPTAIHGLMGLVVGYFFEGSVVDLIKKRGE